MHSRLFRLLWGFLARLKAHNSFTIPNYDQTWQRYKLIKMTFSISGQMCTYNRLNYNDYIYTEDKPRRDFHPEKLAVSLILFFYSAPDRLSAYFREENLEIF